MKMPRTSLLLIAIFVSSSFLNPAYASLRNLSGGTIVIDTTLNVPADYSSIQDALFCLSGKTIEDDITVTIQVADGTYTDYDTIIVDHPDGDKINILGNVANPSLVEISFKASTAGLKVLFGNQLGLIDGFVFDGVDKTAQGILASQNALVRTGSNMTVKRFSIGVNASIGSTIYCAGIVATDNGAQGFVSSLNSIIYCSDSDSTYNGSAGYWAERQGTIFAANCVSSFNLIGAYAQDKSYVHVESGTLTNNTNHGVRVIRFSYAHNGGATVSSNGTNYSPTPGVVGNQNSLITN